MHAVAETHPYFGGVERTESAQVGSTAERRSDSCDHDDSNGVVVLGLRQGRAETVDECRIQGVLSFRTVQPDVSDGSGCVVEDRAFAHGFGSTRWRTLSRPCL